VFAVGRRRPDPAPPVRVGTGQLCGTRDGILLPTPVARDGDPNGRGEGSPEYWARRRLERPTEGIPLGAAMRLLPTPVRGDARRGHNSTNSRGEIDLAGISRLLPSPRASDGSNGGPNQGIASGDIALSSAVIGDRWAQFAPAVAQWEAITGMPAPDPIEPTARGGGGWRLAAPMPGG
jgi:DNA (cytosine-5)-methyltransferase 1